MEMQEIYKVIGNIQEDMIKQTDNSDYGYSIVMNSNGSEIFIKFFDCFIWRSDEDEREFDDEINEYEDLETFLRTEIQMIIDELKNIKLLEA